LSYREIDVAAPVVFWLQSGGWDVYQEVDIRRGRADIVAVKDGTVWIVEVKAVLNLEILGQVSEWKGWAHRVSFAVPCGTRRSGWATRGRGLNHRQARVVRAVHEMYGVGCLLVDMKGRALDPSMRVHEEMAATHEAKPALAGVTTRSLMSEQKTFAKAGSSGTYWTPFKRTCEDLRKYVWDHTGCGISEAVEHIETHYSSKSSAKTNLLTMVQTGVVPGVRAELVGRKYRLYRDYETWGEPMEFAEETGSNPFEEDT